MKKAKLLKLSISRVVGLLSTTPDYYGRTSGPRHATHSSTYPRAELSHYSGPLIFSPTWVYALTFVIPFIRWCVPLAEYITQTRVYGSSVQVVWYLCESRAPLLQVGSTAVGRLRYGIFVIFSR
jgi:hypothetical protein